MNPYVLLFVSLFVLLIGGMFVVLFIDVVLHYLYERFIEKENNQWKK